jgi:hypothetical protein
MHKRDLNKKRLLFIFMMGFVLLCFNATKAFAQPECDWSEIKESLYSTESAGSGGYTAVGPNTKYGRPLGKYQFIPPTLNTMIDRNPNCNAQHCRCGTNGSNVKECPGRPLLNPNCHAQQECLADALLASNLQEIRNDPDCQALLANGGQQITGSGQGETLSCRVTESGLLAAFHLGGSDECENIRNGRGDSDNTGTSTEYYVCKHGGKPVPGNCTPADYGNTVIVGGEPPFTLTLKQLEFMEESGDPNINTGGCDGCGQCGNCPTKIHQNHEIIRAHESAEFEAHRSWIVTTWWVELVAPALAAMTSEFTANMMLQVKTIGAFFDAKHQLETQRLFQHLTAKAHKDYHPSEELCAIGTNTRSLASSERKSNLAYTTISNRMMQRQLSSGDISSIDGRDSDRRTRLKAVVDTYCRPSDNGGDFETLCKATDQERMNMDVDYTAAFENKLTLELDFSNDKAGDVSDDEENIFALGANLFGHDVIKKIPAGNMGLSPTEIYDNAYLYLDYRAVAAKRSVAQNSFAAIVAMRAEGDSSDEATGPFLKAILKESGIEPDEIEKRLGENPSYFAQMEVMTKDLYQNPKFYAGLYDKPVNVERQSVALQAIELMQDRDIYKSLLRSEAVLATLVETLLLQEHDRLSSKIDNMGEGK